MSLQTAAQAIIEHCSSMEFVRVPNDKSNPIMWLVPVKLIDTLRAELALAAEPETFEQAWARFEAAGYRYGASPLEGVRFGFNIARGERP